MTQRILVADTETSGLGPDAEIVELAYLEIDEDMNTLDSFDVMVCPKGLITPEASAASGITNLMVEKCLPIEAYIGGNLSETYLCAHNCKFDYRMLKPYWNITGTLCTYRAAMKYFPDAPKHQLQVLRHYLGIEVDAEAHRALGDVLTTYELIKKLLEVSGLDLIGLTEEMDKPIDFESMPWGKHRGVRMEDLSWGYCKWLLGLEDLDPDLRESIMRRRG